MKAEEVKLADVEIEEVRPTSQGFTLLGSGADRAAYRLELVLDFPLDTQTRRVLGELMSQLVVRVYRCAGTPAARNRRTARRPAAPAD